MSKSISIIPNHALLTAATAHDSDKRIVRQSVKKTNTSSSDIFAHRHLPLYHTKTNDKENHRPFFQNALKPKTRKDIQEPVHHRASPKPDTTDEVNSSLKIQKNIAAAIRLHAYLKHHVSLEEKLCRRTLSRYEKDFEHIQKQLSMLNSNGSEKKDSSKQVHVLLEKINLIQLILHRYYKSLQNKTLKRSELDSVLEKEEPKTSSTQYRKREELNSSQKRLEQLSSRKAFGRHTIAGFNDLSEKRGGIRARIEPRLTSASYEQLHRVKKTLTPSIRLCCYLLNRAKDMEDLPATALFEGQQKELERIETRLVKLGTGEASAWNLNKELKQIELAVAQIQENLQKNYKALPKNAPRARSKLKKPEP